MRKDSTDLSIILVTYNAAETLAKSLDSLVQNRPKKFSSRIIVVDNASSDNSVKIAKSYAEVEVIEVGKNLGFGAGNNLGMKHAPACYYYLHNTDAYLQENVLDEAIAALETAPKVGIAGLPLVYPDHSPQTSAYSFSSPLKWALQGLGVGTALRRILRSKPGRIVFSPIGLLPMGKTFFATESGAAQELEDGSLSHVDWVCGAAFILRDEVREKTGGFDENIFLYGEDEDLCRMATNMNWNVAQISVTPVIHDFGWGKSGRTSPTVAQLKADSLKIFIDKHFKPQSPNWFAMRIILAIKRRVWGV